VATLLCEVPEGDTIATSCADAVSFAGVDIQILIEILPTIEQEIEELADALRIDVIPSNVYSLMAQTLSEKLRVASC